MKNYMIDLSKLVNRSEKINQVLFLSIFPCTHKKRSPGGTHNRYLPYVSYSYRIWLMLERWRAWKRLKFICRGNTYGILTMNIWIGKTPHSYSILGGRQVKPFFYLVNLVSMYLETIWCPWSCTGNHLMWKDSVSGSCRWGRSVGGLFAVPVLWGLQPSAPFETIGNWLYFAGLWAWHKGYTE